MPPREDMDCSADYSDDGHQKTVHLHSEDSTLQYTPSEEPENHEVHEDGKPVADSSDRGPPAKNNEEKGSYAERENRELAAQVSSLKRENARLDALKTKSEGDLVFLQGRFDKLDDDRSQLEREKISWSRERKTFVADFRTIENEKIIIESKNEILESQKEKLRLEIREGELERANMKKHFRKLKDEKETLEEQITALNPKQAELRNTVSSLQQGKRALNTQLRVLQNDEKNLRVEKAILQNKLAEFNSAKTKWADTNESLSQMVKDLQREHSQKDEEISRLIDQGSGLAEEISGLRLQYLVDDDSALQEKFHSLHFAIRSWCFTIYDAKPPEQSAVFSRFPLAAPESPTRLFDIADEEVNVLIACTWEWMVKLIFGSTNVETGYNNSPDLWTDNETGFYIHNLELGLQTLGKEDPNRYDLTDNR
jgi:predicted nuclease with TOPRIM domain